MHFHTQLANNSNRTLLHLSNIESRLLDKSITQSTGFNENVHTPRDYVSQLGAIASTFTNICIEY